MKQNFKIAAAFLLFFLFILLPPFAGLSSQGQRVIAVALLAIILWATEALHVGVTSILILILLGITKSVPSISDLFHGFLSPILYFLIGAMAMGGAIVKSGLAQRAANIFLPLEGPFSRIFQADFRNATPGEREETPGKSSPADDSSLIDLPPGPFPKVKVGKLDEELDKSRRVSYPILRG